MVRLVLDMAMLRLFRVLVKRLDMFHAEKVLDEHTVRIDLAVWTFDDFA